MNKKKRIAKKSKITEPIRVKVLLSGNYNNYETSIPIEINSTDLEIKRTFVKAISMSEYALKLKNMYSQISQDIGILDDEYKILLTIENTFFKDKSQSDLTENETKALERLRSIRLLCDEADREKWEKMFFDDDYDDDVSLLSPAQDLDNLGVEDSDDPDEELDEGSF